MFKNAVFFRVEPEFKITTEMLAKRPATPCGPQDFQSAGFAPPRQSAPDLLTHTVGDYTLVALEVEQRILPTAVIKEEVAERVKTIEDNEGRRVGRRERRELEESVTVELLPKSFTRKKRIYAVFTPGLLIIEGGKTQAETMVEMLHRTLDESPFSPLKVAVSPASKMTDWLASASVSGMTVDNYCQLVSANNDSITYRTSLDGDDIRERIANGYLATRIGVTIGERASLVVTEKFEIKQFALLDIVVDNAHQEGAENEDERFDIDLTLYVGELLRVIDFLVEAFGGEVQDLADQGSETAKATPEGDGSANDPLYETAVRIVGAEQRVSISLVQRHLRIGYNRSAMLIEAMEKNGLVSAQNSQGVRQWLGEAA